MRQILSRHDGRLGIKILTILRMSKIIDFKGLNSILSHSNS